MKKSGTTTPNKPVVAYFQRRPRKGFSFSLEAVFEDLRKALAGKIESRIYICKCYNDGYLTKLVNITEAARRQSPTINHITGEVHFLDLLMRKKTVVLTILDCGMMARKTGMAQKIVNWLYLKAPIRKARYVTAISETTRQEILRYTGCPPEKIQVIPVAVDAMYQPAPKPFDAARPHILHIGTGPNKNLLRLIAALAGLPCHLMIVGKLPPEILAALAQHKVEYTNYYNIPAAELLQCYRDCDLLAFVSTFEGFGMPIVEANAVERPVITSNISSMPEIAADAACLVDPYDVEAIRAGIDKMIDNEAYRNELIANGRRNKLRFDAAAIAGKYYAIYCEMTSSPGLPHHQDQQSPPAAGWKGIPPCSF